MGNFALHIFCDVGYIYSVKQLKTLTHRYKYKVNSLCFKIVIVSQTRVKRFSAPTFVGVFFIFAEKISMRKYYNMTKKELEDFASMYAEMYHILSNEISDIIYKLEEGNEIKDKLRKANLKAEEVMLGCDDVDNELIALFTNFKTLT